MMRRPHALVLVASAQDAGLRLDRFLREKSGVLSRTRARDLLAAGGVTLNGSRVKIASRQLRAGDRVEVHVLPEASRSHAPAGVEPFRVVYEDTWVIVVDKAAGVLVQPTPQGDRGTLIDLLSRYLRKRHPGTKAPYLGLLHRIDRETSGLLLFSRKGSANRILAEQFRGHAIAREYLAVARGSFAGDSGTISDSLFRPAPGARRASRPRRGLGVHAVTHYQVLERFLHAQLLSLTLETGRTHQIRIHLSEKGHPVVGDKVYGRRAAGVSNALLDAFPRQALHAFRLGFTHPATGEQMSFETPPPDDFAGLLRALREPVESRPRGF